MLAHFSAISANDLNIFSALLGAFVGSGITICWDYFKLSHDARLREKNMMLALENDLILNLQRCQENTFILNQDLIYLQQSKTVIIPLKTLNESLWNLLRLNLPNKITVSPGLLGLIPTVYNSLQVNNQLIQSRENYRINNGSMSNYNERSIAYNNAIIQDSSLLIQQINVTLIILREKRERFKLLLQIREMIIGKENG